MYLFSELVDLFSELVVVGDIVGDDITECAGLIVAFCWIKAGFAESDIFGFGVRYECVDGAVYDDAVAVFQFNVRVADTVIRDWLGDPSRWDNPQGLGVIGMGYLDGVALSVKLVGGALWAWSRGWSWAWSRVGSGKGGWIQALYGWIGGIGNTRRGCQDEDRAKKSRDSHGSEAVW